MPLSYSLCTRLFSIFISPFLYVFLVPASQEMVLHALFAFGHAGFQEQTNETTRRRVRSGLYFLTISSRKSRKKRSVATPPSLYVNVTNKI